MNLKRIRERNFRLGVAPPVHEEASQAGREDVPRSVSEVLQRAVAPDPEARFESIVQYVHALEEALRRPLRGSVSPAIFVCYQDEASAGWAVLLARELKQRYSIAAFVDTQSRGATPSFVSTFGTANDFSAAESPSSVAIADLNADGRPDLAVAKGGYNTVSVLLNLGTVIAMGFDFKPHDLNLNSNGKWVTGFLRPPAPYLASQIDVNSIRLNGGVVVSTEHPTKIEDHDTKLNVKFLRSEVKPT